MGAYSIFCMKLVYLKLPNTKHWIKQYFQMFKHCKIKKKNLFIAYKLSSASSRDMYAVGIGN